MSGGPGGAGVPSNDVTRLLSAWRSGDEGALVELLPKVVDELRRIAAGYLRDERPDHTLQATAVVNEAYLRLAGAAASFENRAHFFGAAARAMRQVLVDHARRHEAAKRPSSGVRVTLSDAPTPEPLPAIEVLALHEALDRLETISPRQARIVELRYFAGMSEPEVAEALDSSVATIAREWRLARMMLRRWLVPDAADADEAS